ncbi:hypothetical protein B0A52_08870 [Exophiala mesophila]|uniref:DUF2470 domain-containing protein n=1 Tax=Exophiala mesophila TaxID=212818 RepID=A0A438MUT9_EXOME|nr:hypothetical protein B0A52_08870 [Exophiala mesophila]
MSQSASATVSPIVARGPPDPAAMKARIISHMNADHQLSLRAYLQLYANVPSLSTRSSKLEDITNEHMILTSSFGRHVIPFSPPLKSLAEARERLVAMHNDCLQALDLSDIVIDSYYWPDKLWQYPATAFILLILITFPFPDSLLPHSNSLIYQIWSLGGLAPGLAALCHTLAFPVWFFIVAVHAAESVWLSKTRLRKHWIEPGTGVWMAWMADCALKGFSAFQRFDQVVKEKEAAKRGRGQH